MVDYKGESNTKLSDAWQLAQEQIKKSQASRKQYYDTFANEHAICVGDRVYVCTPAKKTGTAYKFACPFVGPYRFMLYDTGVDERLISKPFAKPFRVALGRVRLCPAEIPDRFQLPTSDTNANDGTEDVEVCTVDENAEKLEQNGEDIREAVTQAQDYGQFENNGTVLPVKSVPETRESVRNRIKWKKRFCPRRVKKLLHK